MIRAAALLCTVLHASLAVAQVAPVRVFPTNPAAGEDFVIQFNGSTPSSPAYLESTTASLSDNRLKLVANVRQLGFSVPGAFRAGAVANVAVPGIYPVDLEVRSAGWNATAPNAIAVSVGPAVPRAEPLHRNLSGLWWAPDESGWGLNVTQGDSGHLFVVWYTYRPPGASGDENRGAAIWLSLSNGRWISPTEFRGVLYETQGTGGNFAYQPSAVRMFPAGIGIVRAVSADRLDFEADTNIAVGTTYSYTPNFAEVAKRKTLQRFIF